MYSKIKSTILGFLLLAGLVFAHIGDRTQAVGVVPPWLADATEVAITLDGVNSAQAMKSGLTTHWLVLRATRDCSEYDALWNELRAQTGPPPIGLFPGWCWQRTAGPQGSVTGVDHLLTWTYKFGKSPLPGRPAVILRNAARTLDGVIDAEAWRSPDLTKPNVLAMYRTGECPASGVAQDAMIKVVKDAAEAAGIVVVLHGRKCYANLMGPIYRDAPQAGATYVHMRHVTKG